ncbi:unnamed protein product [Leptidea sinapis]|uniref:dolichyl-diphosphooligosaccharide--protein glycotransferase n=1 Tax=Leptidea sinapis TaxID=189913 RepID=A0A5E4PZ92_9NEOP|nr:unnamed protein product [Leptidea sinapis]
MPATATAKPGAKTSPAIFHNTAGFSTLITVTVLTLAWLAGFASRLFAVIRFESIIHEFDPWFNYRSTAYMVEHGFYNFLNWFDERAWYPLGRIVGGTVYPGLMITSGTIHWILHALNIPVHIRDICVFLAPVFSGLTAISTYLLTSELWSRGAGLFAACFIAIVPGYSSRSVAGSYDNEGIAIFALQFTYYLWLKSVKSGSVFWSICTALSYFYMRLFVSYTVFYIIGLVYSMQIPFVGFQPIRTSEHMAASGVFALLMVVGAMKYLHSLNPKGEWKQVLIFGTLLAAGAVFLAVVLLTYMGVIAPWSGSCCLVSKQDIVKVALYALSAVYFAGVMVRLMLTLTPVVCVLAGIAFSIILDLMLKEDDVPVVPEIEETKNLYDKAVKTKKRSQESTQQADHGLGAYARPGTVIAFMVLLMLFSVHCTWATSNAYSSPSIVLASYGNDGSRKILDDFREAYGWLSQNTAEDARVMSWWDYGYQEADYFTERGEYRVDSEGSKTMLNCLMYKLSYYRYDSGGSPPGYDRTRNALPGNRGFKLTYLEEAYTTEHWLVRIYRI